MLIQETDADVRGLLERLVEHFGHEPLLWEGEGAPVPDVDILLLDPEAGLATALALREQDPSVAIVCVALHPPSPELEALRPAGCLYKPFGVAELRDALAAAAESRRAG